jgi:hypothetical protein
MRGPLQIRRPFALAANCTDHQITGGANINGHGNNVLLTMLVQQTVLGGCVAELVKDTNAALQQAKFEAGVGVDPTVEL